MNVPNVRLLETMRWGGPVEGVALLDRHLARVAASADAFGFRYEEAAVRAALGATTGGLPDAPHRLRLMLDAAGDAFIQGTPLGGEDRIRKVTIHPQPVEPGGPFWRHKTTHRPHYEGPYRRARAGGFDEAILLDRDGHVVEGTRTTVWIARGGRLLTPPRSAGGLPGVMRAHLLATRPDTDEAPLTRADLLRADAVLLSNAVRGLFGVEVVRQGPPR